MLGFGRIAATAERWRWHDCTFPRTLEDGTRSAWSTTLMRRRVGRRWVYRKPTPEEMGERANDLAW